MNKLLIVESPAKAKTISKYLGNGYEVLSSVGHIRDLPSKGMNVEIENNFEPTYAVNADKKKVVTQLKKAAKAASEVILATDDDREGEAIAWHLCHALGLDPATTKRIIFHEVTKSAFEQAIKEPTTVKQNLVDAQQARRVLDRIVGYELSPVLWKKVQRGLSAGRVQSVAVRLIVEREREVEAFEGSSAYRVSGLFDASGAELPAELQKKLESKDTATELLKACADAEFKVTDVVEKPGSRKPSAPFTTSTLQQEAARRLGFGVKQTMQLAQRLYESGHITYMRTDSISLSGQAIASAVNHIENAYGKEYVEVRKFKTKNASAQEAHTAISPTNMTVSEAGADDRQMKLYNLIWRRTVASQMAPAKLTKTQLIIPIPGREEKFVAKGEVLVFDGFLKVYGGAKDDVILPKMAVGDTLPLISAQAHETFERPPARYSEASLVRTLEELGIGRPSTYAPTISTIQDRGYVENVDVEPKQRQAIVVSLEKSVVAETKVEENYGGDKGKLLPTPVADMVTTFLVEHFKDVLDYDFTRSVEEGFDRIEAGEIQWQKFMAEFYKDFHPLVEKAEGVSRAEVSNMREVGQDPKDGKMIYARNGRFGPMLQKGKAEDQEEKPDFAPMPKGAAITTVSLEQALESFKLPRTVGQTEEGEDIKANVGRYGPYVQVGKMYASIKDLDPTSITLEEARAAIADKKEQEAKKVVADWGDVRILNGPYGPYITDGKKNARIAKDVKPETIKEEEARELLKAAKPSRKKRKTVKKK